MDLVLQIVNNPSGAGGVGGGTGGGGTACHPGLLWCGISGRQLGKVEPNTSLVLDLKMIALQSGLQVGVVFFIISKHFLYLFIYELFYYFFIVI